MAISAKPFLALTVTTLAWQMAPACSPNAGDTGNDIQSSTATGGAGSGKADASLQPGSPNPGGPGPGNGGPFHIGSQDGGKVTFGLEGSACNAIKQKPETVIVYRDATVTDTITTYKPVALFIMQDRSSSMWTGNPSPASKESWSNSTAAVTAFVNDQASRGIDVGLGVFPPMSYTDQNNQGDCAAGSDCGKELVPIAALPGNAAAMLNGYQTANPTGIGGNNTPTECALRGMINTCLQFQSQSVTGEQCVAVLVTDGTPTRCNTNQQALASIVQEGHNLGVTTYVLGLPGSDINFLNQLANVGGTNAAINVSGGSQSFITALNNIRQAISVKTQTQISQPVTISTPLPCQWKVPDPPSGQLFDPAKVNVQFTPPGATSAVHFGHVDSLAACANTAEDAWYYDSNTNPTAVLVCPNTCNGTLRKSSGAQVDVLFGCATVPAGVH